MARGINKVILIGNLGADPETRAMPSGMTVANIRIATSENWKDKQSGENKERTEWHNVAMFGRLGEIAGEYLKKGSKVYIEGSLRTRKWQDKQGNDRPQYRPDQSVGTRRGNSHIPGEQIPDDGADQSGQDDGCGDQFFVGHTYSLGRNAQLCPVRSFEKFLFVAFNLELLRQQGVAQRDAVRLPAVGRDLAPFVVEEFHVAVGAFMDAVPALRAPRRELEPQR